MLPFPYLQSANYNSSFPCKCCCALIWVKCLRRCPAYAKHFVSGRSFFFFHSEGNEEQIQTVLSPGIILFTIKIWFRLHNWYLLSMHSLKKKIRSEIADARKLFILPIVSFLISAGSLFYSRSRSDRFLCAEFLHAEPLQNWPCPIYLDTGGGTIVTLIRAVPPGHEDMCGNLNP